MVPVQWVFNKIMEHNDKLNGKIRLGVSSSLLFLSVFILLLSTKSLVGIPARISLSFISFFQKGFSSVGSFFSDTFTSIVELKDLQEKYNDLLKRTASLGTLERDYSEIKRENEELKTLLNFQENSSYRSISCKIIGKDPSNLNSSFVLNKGLKHGIRKNQAVIAYIDGIEGLIGRVIEVSNSASIVMPIFDASAYIAVRLARSRYEGLASGGGSDDDNLVVKYIKKRAKEEIQFGDLVITSGLQSLYPAGIIVGRVIKVRELEYLTSLEIEVEPAIDFSKIEYVFVIDSVVEKPVEKGME